MLFKKICIHVIWVTLTAIGIFPLIVLLCVLGGTGLGLSVLLMGILLITIWIGTGSMLMLSRQYQKHRVVVTGSIILIALGLGMACIYLVPYASVVLRLLYGVLLGICFWGSTRLVFYSLEHLIQPYVFIGFCLENIFVIILLTINQASFLKLPLIVVIILESAVFAFFYNEKAKENLLVDRSGEIQKLPKEMKKNNRRQMWLLFGIGLILVCFCGWIADFFKWLLHLMVMGLRLFFRWLLALGSSDAVVDMPPQMSESPMVQPVERGESWVGTAFLIGIGILLLILLIWKRHEIVQMMANIWMKAQYWIRSRILRRQRITENQHDFYCDYVEDLLIMEKGNTVTIPYKHRNSWNRGYRRYRKMAYSTEKFRFGYALLLEKLPPELNTLCDSPREVLDKVKLLYNEENQMWNAITDAYMEVRYGEKQPKEVDFIILDELLHDGR